MMERAALTDSPVSPDDAAALIRGRRTVSNFQPDRFPDPGIIRQALELARWAPNHHLTEPWRFHLIGEKTKTAIIDLNTRLLTSARGAEVARTKRERWQAIPGWLAVTCRPADDPVTAREDHAACACAVQNILLYLHSADLGGKWTSGAVTREDDFLRLLHAREGEYCIAMIWYGYPAIRPRTQRHALAEVASHLE